VRLATHEAGPRPEVDPDDYDVLLSVDRHAPAPWVGLAPRDLRAAVQALNAVHEQQPVAARLACEVLRMTMRLGFEEALELESIAYSMLLASEGFQAWRARTPVRQRAEPDAPRVLIGEEHGAVAIRLNRPGKRNAFDAAMRDELCAALAFAREDPDQRPVVLMGEGPAFSAGGDLDEFGTAKDPGRAHLIRMEQSPARLARQLGERLTVRLQGACVGAGIEVPAAAARVLAAEGTFFRLPEVSMGLIPGAGGTATITRRIGRHRTAYMALSGADIDLATALAWGLVDALA
jgi:enoyl-CoA hydratase/carnithine racemase